MHMDLKRSLFSLFMHILYSVCFGIISQKFTYNSGIMQLAMLAPYSNLATSVAAALVPTLLGPAKMKGPEESEPVNANKNAEGAPPEGNRRQQIFYHKSPTRKYTYFY